MAVKDELKQWVKEGRLTEEEASHFLKFGAKSKTILKVIDLRNQDKAANLKGLCKIEGVFLEEIYDEDEERCDGCEWEPKCREELGLEMLIRTEEIQ